MIYKKSTNWCFFYKLFFILQLQLCYPKYYNLKYTLDCNSILSTNRTILSTIKAIMLNELIKFASLKFITKFI